MAILYSIAKTESGKLIKAAEAEKGPLYFCPHCNTTLVLKKGQKKRPHFAHKSLSPNCKPETALHYGFKTLLAEKIRGHLDRNQALDIAWDCKACGGHHSGNLLKKAVAVELEHDLKVCRPDIALLDDRGKVIAAIEVIVTHSPEQSTLDYFRSNNIALVCFELKSDEDVSRLERSTLKPDNVEVCRNPKCNQCGRHMPKQSLLIIDGQCWKCDAPLKVAALQGDLGYVGELSEEHIGLAAEHGVILKSQYSRTTRSKYVANTCSSCGKFVGGHYLFSNYVAVLDYPRIEVEAGYYCPVCQ